MGDVISGFSNNDGFTWLEIERQITLIPMLKNHPFHAIGSVAALLLPLFIVQPMRSGEIIRSQEL